MPPLTFLAQMASRNPIRMFWLAHPVPLDRGQCGHSHNSWKLLNRTEFGRGQTHTSTKIPTEMGTVGKPGAKSDHCQRGIARFQQVTGLKDTHQARKTKPGLTQSALERTR